MQTSVVSKLDEQKPLASRLEEVKEAAYAFFCDGEVKEAAYAFFCDGIPHITLIKLH